MRFTILLPSWLPEISPVAANKSVNKDNVISFGSNFSKLLTSSVDTLLALILLSILVNTYKESNVSTITNLPLVPLIFKALIFFLIISSHSALASSDHIPLREQVSPSY